MGDDLKCEYCGFEYRSIISSQVILHLCADQELHFRNRIDLTETPLIDLEKDIPDYKPIERKYYYKIIKN